ncbi:MAG: IS256 family transposase [Thermoanaerobaculia bacterium]
MRKYQIVNRNDSLALKDFLVKEGQVLLPFVESIERAEKALDEVIDVAGRATIEAVLQLSARKIAGEKHPGREGSEIRWHGKQGGVVSLSERQLRVRRPRLRKKGEGKGGEVPIPAYEAMRSSERLSQRMWEILMLGVSTRKYQEVLPKMAETVGVSKSEVSRQFVEGSAEVLKQLMERRLDEWDILIVYVDGIVFGDYHAIAAIGVDTEGSKHVLGLREGASENQVVTKALLEDLVERGLKPGRRRLFVIDGSKALRVAIDAVFGSENLVQRCRKHKERNVLGYLPKELKLQVQSTLRAAWQLPAEKGKARLEKLAKWFEHEYPSAAESVREGLDEMFTISELGLPSSLSRCLGTTNIIESCFSGARGRTRRVTNWHDGSMVLRWAASALLATEKHFRRILGFEYLPILEAKLAEPAQGKSIVRERKVS